MKKNILLLVPIIILLAVTLYNCDLKKKFGHNLPSNHPLVKIQDRLEEIILYSQNSIVKIYGGENTDIYSWDLNSLNYRDWIIGSGFVFKKDDNTYIFLPIITLLKK